MSFTFTFELPERVQIPVKSILGSHTAPWPLIVDAGLLEKEYWPDGHTRLRIENHSTRGVTITKVGQQLEVRLSLCASAPDHHLAIQMVAQLMVETGALVQAQDSEDYLSPGPFARLFNTEWVEAQTRSGPLALVGFLKVRGQMMTIPGVTRAWHIDPASLAELTSNGPQDELPDRILNDILRVQNLDVGDAYDASLIRLDNGATVVTLGPGMKYLLPKADRVALMDESGDPPLFLDWEQFLELVPAVAVDAGQVLVPPQVGSKWQELRRAGVPAAPSERAKPNPSTPQTLTQAETPASQRPWWKFW